jgi:type II secretory pathway pseudopilin PulG
MTRRPQEGTALVVVLMAMVLLATIGAALVLITSGESAIAGNLESATEALYAADAMLAHAIRDLRQVPDWTPVLNGTAVSAFVDGSVHGTRAPGGGVTVDLDRVVNEADCHRSSCTPSDLIAITQERPWGNNNPQWRVFACGTLAALLGGAAPDRGLYVVAMVADDGSEIDGDPNQDGASVGGVANPGAGVIEVRAESFGTNRAHRVVQATITRFSTVEVGVGPVTEVRVLAWREVQ